MPRSLENKCCFPLRASKSKSREGRGGHNPQSPALWLPLTQQTTDMCLTNGGLKPSTTAFINSARQRISASGRCGHPLLPLVSVFTGYTQMCKHLPAAPSRACPPPWLLAGDHRMPLLSRPAHVCSTPRTRQHQPQRGGDGLTNIGLYHHSLPRDSCVI